MMQLRISGVEKAALLIIVASLLLHPASPCVKLSQQPCCLHISLFTASLHLEGHMSAFETDVCDLC
jgi:hypothetical protein